MKQSIARKKKMKLSPDLGRSVAPISFPETFHLSRHPHLKDSIEVQTSDKHNYVNDSQKHEEHPHLQDYLKPHHTLHVETSDGEDNEYLDSIPCAHRKDNLSLSNQKRLTLARPATGELWNRDCRSRKACHETEAKRTVKFKDVIVREYGMILGDHPSCRFGLPVSLEWDYVEYKPLDVDDYEIHHALRRPLRQMIIPSRRRHEMIKSLGYAMSDMNKAKKELNRTKTQRFRTHQMPLPLVYLDTGIESLVRKIKRYAESRWA